MILIYFVFLIFLICGFNNGLLLLYINVLLFFKFIVILDLVLVIFLCEFKFCICDLLILVIIVIFGWVRFDRNLILWKFDIFIFNIDILVLLFNFKIVKGKLILLL